MTREQAEVIPEIIGYCTGKKMNITINDDLIKEHLYTIENVQYKRFVY